jgi:hypothetical protein
VVDVLIEGWAAGASTTEFAEIGAQRARRILWSGAMGIVPFLFLGGAKVYTGRRETQEHSPFEARSKQEWLCHKG